MKPIRKIYSMVATDADGIALSQTPTGAGDLTLAGALTSGGALSLAIAQFLTITTGADESGKTFTIYGTDNIGAAITETITGPSTTTATSTKQFKTVSRIAVSAATTGAVTAGVSGTAEFPWIPLCHYKTPFEFSYYVNIGTATYQVESTLDNVQDATITPVVNATVKASGSADGGGNSTAQARAIRVKVTAFTTGDIIFNVNQSG